MANTYQPHQRTLKFIDELSGVLDGLGADVRDMGEVAASPKEALIIGRISGRLEEIERLVRRVDMSLKGEIEQEKELAYMGGIAHNDDNIPNRI